MLAEKVYCTYYLHLYQAEQAVSKTELHGAPSYSSGGQWPSPNFLSNVHVCYLSIH
jgi:hypothetical protein